MYGRRTTDNEYVLYCPYFFKFLTTLKNSQNFGKSNFEILGCEPIKFNWKVQLFCDRSECWNNFFLRRLRNNSVMTKSRLFKIEVCGGRPSKHDSKVCGIQKIRILKIKYKENLCWSKCQSFLDSQIFYRIELLLRILKKVYFQRSDFCVSTRF